MPDETPAPTAEAAAPAAEQQAAQPDATTEPADTTDWKAEARKWEQRAKDNQKAAKDMEQARKSAMTDAERAVAEARESAAAEVRAQYGSRLAQTEFRAAAAARNAGFDVEKALKYVNFASLLGEDGEPDTKAIKAAVADLIPQVSEEAPPSFDGGTRTAASSGPTMTQLIRQAAGRA